jgi:segregation and condensation protein A
VETNHSYQVDLPDFQGPLDLLLNLIQDAELDITKISLAKVTKQYLAYLEIIERFNPTELTDFLVIAARLILIKSEALLPQSPATQNSDHEEDVGEELARQLLAYKQFKEIALRLREIEEQGLQNFVRTAPPPKVETQITALQISLNDLLQAARLALVIRPPDQNVDEVVSREIVTIGQQMTLIRERLVTDENIMFRELLHQHYNRVEIIVTLLAVLELVKRHVIQVEQERLFGEIAIYRSVNTPRLTEADWNELAGQVELT